jgi:hypothetical protein
MVRFLIFWCSAGFGFFVEFVCGIRKFGSSGGAWTVGLCDRSGLGRVEYGFGGCNEQVGEFVNSVLEDRRRWHSAVIVLAWLRVPR